jgi:uncharacterized protein YndB with AHSA1/START domain
MSSTIELHQAIDAPAHRIWKACVQPRGIANWQADEVEGDARKGGTLRLHWSAFETTIELQIVAWEPERFIALQHDDAIVEFHIEDRGVKLIQRGVGSADDFDGLHSSWRLALAQLAHSVERHPGRQRRVQWLVRALPTTAELVYLSLTDPHLDSWLCSSGGIGPEGERYKLTLQGGPTLSGRVLANTPGRDIALSCAEAGEAVLAFRTLRAPNEPGQRLVAAVWSEWGTPRPAADEIVETIDARLDRLAILLRKVGAA